MQPYSQGLSPFCPNLENLGLKVTICVSTLYIIQFFGCINALAPSFRDPGLSLNWVRYLWNIQRLAIEILELK